MSDRGSEFEFGREIRLRLAFAAVGAVLGLGVAVFTDAPDWVAFAVVLVVGLAAPRLFTED
jgi:hypothetical protein